MWDSNPWNLSFGQFLSLAFVIGGFFYVFAKMLEELQRIRRTLEAIETKLHQSDFR